jgi:hypothetical protein
VEPAYKEAFRQAHVGRGTELAEPLSAEFEVPTIPVWNPALVLLGALSLAACSGPVGPTPGSDRPAAGKADGAGSDGQAVMVGGAPDGRSAAVGALMDEYGPMCGATVFRCEEHEGVSKGFAVTAAHCLDPFARFIAWVAKSGEVLPIERWFLHPRFDEALRHEATTHDIAVIRLAECPSERVVGYEPISLGERPPGVDDPFLLLGYPDRGEPPELIDATEEHLPERLTSGFGDPLAVSLSAAHVYPDAVAFLAFDGASNPSNPVPASWASNCSGDSGGPALTQNAAGEWVIAGVTSWGDKTPCDRFAVSTRIDAYRGFIEAAVEGRQDAAGTGAPCQSNSQLVEDAWSYEVGRGCFYADGVCDLECLARDDGPDPDCIHEPGECVTEG